MDLDNLFDRVSTDVKTNFYPSVKTIFLSNREGKSESGNFNLTKKLKFTS